MDKFIIPSSTCYWILLHRAIFKERGTVGVLQKRTKHDFASRKYKNDHEEIEPYLVESYSSL